MPFSLYDNSLHAIFYWSYWTQNLGLIYAKGFPRTCGILL